MYHWPILDLYGARSIGELAVRCLEPLYGMPLRSQFRYCRIVELYKCFFKSDNHGYLLSRNDRVTFSIELNSKDTLEEWLFTVPHEMAHTMRFHFSGDMVVFGWIHYPQEEEFADCFARYWLEVRDNKKQLKELLRRMEKTREHVSVLNTPYYRFEQKKKPSVFAPNSEQLLLQF